ncbi:Forkhead box protein N3 [Eumeta japonica]|uniref:Forkhead box protein N3 n=1 Tax=Eumeta variegata TaxID=151549 RepID=A0A4C1XNJ4_EUMVA|nr:Forkhead box protein N3 [Eumeta japonica]
MSTVICKQTTQIYKLFYLLAAPDLEEGKARHQPRAAVSGGAKTMIIVLWLMAPMRGERGGSPARGARAALPLSRRVIRQIARHVASSGRSLRRLEVSGRVIDNFDDIDDLSDDSDQDMPLTAIYLLEACAWAEMSLSGVRRQRGQPTAAGARRRPHEPQLATRPEPAQRYSPSPAVSGTLTVPRCITSLSFLGSSFARDVKVPDECPRTVGINLSKGDVEDGKLTGSQVIIKTEQPTTPPPAPRAPSPPRTPSKAPPSPTLSPHTKPPYSFSCLIFMAIEAAPARALPVKEIYAWIVKHFPYYRDAPQGWKNSVRHNLSLNKCFHKVAATPGLGKGSLWTVDPQHRVTLLQVWPALEAHQLLYLVHNLITSGSNSVNGVTNSIDQKGS